MVYKCSSRFCHNLRPRPFGGVPDKVKLSWHSEPHISPTMERLFHRHSRFGIVYVDFPSPQHLILRQGIVAVVEDVAMAYRRPLRIKTCRIAALLLVHPLPAIRIARTAFPFVINPLVQSISYSERFSPALIWLSNVSSILYFFHCSTLLRAHRSQ
jgi:hypothetical protein